MLTHLFSALMGLLAGAVSMFFGIQIWLMRHRLMPGAKHKALFRAIRTDLDEASRLAVEYNDTVAAERIATLRAMREEYVFSSLDAMRQWHDELIQVVKLGLFTEREHERRRPIYVAVIRAAETVETLVLMLTNPGAFEDGDPRRG